MSWPCFFLLPTHYHIPCSQPGLQGRVLEQSGFHRLVVRTGHLVPHDLPLLFSQHAITHSTRPVFILRAQPSPAFL